MSDPTQPRRSHHKKAPAARMPVVRPARDTLIIDHESFTAMCRSLLNFSEELSSIARDLSEIKLQNFQVCSNQEALSGDIASIISRLAVLEQLAQTPPAPAYRPAPPSQYDQHGHPMQPRQLPQRERGAPPPPLREMLRGMQGVPQSSGEGFIPGGNDPENGGRR